MLLLNPQFSLFLPLSGSSQSCQSLPDSTCSTSSSEASNLNLDEVSKKLSRMGTSIAFVTPSKEKKQQEQKKKPSGLIVIQKGGTK